MSRLSGERMICLTSLLDLSHGCARMPKGPDRLVLDSPLPPRLFAGYPIPAAIKATVVEVHHSEGLHMGQ